MYFTVFLNNTGLLGQNSFSIDGGHAKEGNYPHPEYCAGAAYEDGAAGTDYVTGTNLSCNSGCQSLERAHAAALLAALEGQLAEHVLHAFAEAANLHELGADREVQTAA